MSGAIHFAITHSAPGGLREIWNDVAAGLAARGHPVSRFVLYPGGDAGQRADAEAEGWHHVVPQRATGLLAMPRLFWALVQYLKAERPAAVVTAMPFANVIMPLAVRVAGTDTRVYASHHSPSDTHNPMLARLDAMTGQMGCVAAVISVSRAVDASLAAKPSRYRNKCVVVRNALPGEVEQTIDTLSGPLAPPKVPGRIVALGRLSYQKNYPMLLRAMAGVEAATLDIVGAGEDEPALRQLAAELGVSGRVRFLGQMKRGEALAHAATAQVFAQVSRYEGHSLALIEAARLGLPLVVSDVPEQIEGVTDAGGERCGIVVPLEDDRTLAQVLVRLLADPSEQEAWSERARRLSLSNSNRAMVDAYETLLVSQSGGC